MEDETTVPEGEIVTTNIKGWHKVEGLLDMRCLQGRLWGFATSGELLVDWEIGGLALEMLRAKAVKSRS